MTSEAHSRAEASPPARPRVLLVGDNQRMLCALERLFRHDWELVTASNSSEAWVELGVHTCDAVIVALGGLEAIALLERLRSERPDLGRVLASDREFAEWEKLLGPELAHCVVSMPARKADLLSGVIECLRTQADRTTR